jgi:hypothetical protein
MTRLGRSRYVILITVALLSLLALSAVQPGHAHAAPSGPLGPLQTIPGWLQDALDSLETALVKTLQDTARVGGVLLWGILKVCGMVGLFGNDFSALFGTVVTEALNAVVTGSVHDLIRGSLMVSLGIFGLSLLARPFWPDLRLVSFQRAAIWGIAIQAYLVSAPTVYTELETWRVNLAEEVASAVSTGAIPGCSGDVVEVLLCITGTSSANVLDPDLSNLPDQIPYAGSESVRDLYDHCVYNPPVLYGNPACDPDNPVGDSWEVLDYAQDALGTQLLGLILAFLILAYGVLQISLGLAAGMMFVLFPVAAIFAFYLPLESFPAGVIRNYISIFLKSVVLLTLAGIVIRLFSISTSSLAAMAAVALIDLLLCFIMAKEALASLLSAISFVGSSVSTIGANFGLTGGGSGGGGNPLPSPESRTAATMITNSSTVQTLMGAPHPYGGTGRSILGTAGSALSSPVRTGKAVVQTAAAIGTGGAGFLVGAAAAAKGADYGSLALMGNALTSTLGQDAGRGFVTGAGTVATRQVLQGTRGRPVRGQGGATSRQGPSPSGTDEPTLLVPPVQPTGGTTPILPGGVELMGSLTPGGEPATLNPVNAGLRGDDTAVDDYLSGWTPASAQQIRTVTAKLATASPDVQDGFRSIAGTSRRLATDWVRQQGRSPILEDGTLDPQFTEAVVQHNPSTATAFVQGQQALPPEQRTSLSEAVALGIPIYQKTIPPQEVGRGFAQAVKDMGQDGDLDTALQNQVGVNATEIFGERSPDARQVVAQMQQAGLTNDLGRQLIETVQEDLDRNRRLTPQQFREGGGFGRIARMRQWDRATGDPETTDRIVGGLIGLRSPAQVRVREIPGVGTGPQTQFSSGSDAPPATPTVDMPGATPEPPSQTVPVPAADAPAVTVETAGQTSPPPASPEVENEGYYPDLYEKLRTWRLETATQSGQKAFQVFPNATLERIAAARPQTMEELGAVKGVGPRKLGQYGPAVLDVTRSAPEQPPAAPPPPAEPVIAPASEQIVTNSPDREPGHGIELGPAPVPEPPAAAPAAAETEKYDPTLFEHLRTWRRIAAQESDQKAFHVFSDATLKRIAAAQPTTLGELAAVKGVGPKKLEQYGQGVLGVILRYPTQKGEES